MGSMNQNKMVLVVALASLGVAGTAAVAQSSTPDNSAYQGVSQPPADPIVTSPEAPPVPLAKPSAGVVAQPNQSAYPQPNPRPYPQYGQAYNQPAGTTYGPSSADAVSSPTGYVDPDGDIVHPRPARDGELVEGATIRVRLMDRLSSTLSEKGQRFRGQVASDVLQNGRVLIPTGSEIEGHVSNVSSGHFGGHGSFRLKPDVVILPDGTRYELHAYTTGTPGSKTRVGGEGTINPGSRAKKDSIEYGAVVGTGAITGAVLGGPVGALAGSLVGAGMVTTHIMVDHAQATLEPGAVLLFTLTEPMNLIPPTGQPGS